MKSVDITKQTKGEAKATDRCVYDFLKEDSVTFTVEGTTKDVMGIDDPFTDKRGFMNPACCRLMMEFAKNHEMMEYAHETWYYVKHNNRGLVLTESMFEFFFELGISLDTFQS